MEEQNGNNGEVKHVICLTETIKTQHFHWTLAKEQHFRTWKKRDTQDTQPSRTVQIKSQMPGRAQSIYELDTEW